MTGPEGLEVRWQVTNKGHTPSALLDGTLYVLEKNDIIGYTLETGSPETRISDIDAKTLIAPEGQDILFGATGDAIVAIDPRSEQVRWRWDAPKDGGAGASSSIPICTTENDLYALVEENTSTDDSSYEGTLSFVRFKDFTDDTMSQIIYRSRKYGDTRPPSVGGLRTSGEWVYTYLIGGESILVGWEFWGDDFTVELNHAPWSFDVERDTTYVLSNPRTETQSYLEAFDATTGARLWDTAVPDANTVAAGDGTAVIGGDFGLIGIDAATGSITWENHNRDPVGGLTVADTTLYSGLTEGGSHYLSGFDLSDGSTLFTMEFDRPPEVEDSLTVSGDTIVFTTPNAIVCLDRPASGASTDGSAGRGGESASSEYCSACGGTISADAAYCSHCGTELKAEGCPNCGADLTGDEVFCPQCGTNMRN